MTTTRSEAALCDVEVKSVLLLVLMIAAFDKLAWLVRRYPRLLAAFAILGLYSAWDLRPRMFAFSHTVEVLRRMWPPLMSQAVDVLKATALASSITVPELMYQTYNATSQTFRFVEFYTVSALVYLAICLPLVARLRRLEWRSGV